MKKIIISLIFAFSIPGIALAQGDILQVKTIERPPFVLEDKEGELSGFSIDLWDEIAKTNGWEYEYSLTDEFTKLLLAPQTGEADLAIANISITADREEIMDFSAPIYDGGMLMMVSTGYDRHALLNALMKGSFWVPFLGLLLITLIFTFFMSRFGKRRDMKEAAAVLVGFGHDCKRGIERPIGMLWYALVIVMLIIVSAQVTTVTILTEQNESINSVTDLQFKRVGVIQGSTSEAHLRSLKIKTEAYSLIDRLFSSIEGGSLDAVVHDAPVISHYVKNNSAGNVRIAGELFKKEEYGIALPTDSEYTEQINQTLRRFKENGKYDELYSKWFK